MISQELYQFCERWFEKARAYQGNDVQTCFDRFFTLYVPYNRLYAELTLSWARMGKKQLHGNIPDSLAAKRYVHEYLGTGLIWNCLQNDRLSIEAIRKIRNLLENDIFVIKLDRLNGQPMPEDNYVLLQNLISENPHMRVAALLDIIYSIRCNMFHGHKSFEIIQAEILVPVTIILNKLTSLLYEKMEQDNEIGALQHQGLNNSQNMRLYRGNPPYQF